MYLCAHVGQAYKHLAKCKAQTAGTERAQTGKIAFSHYLTARNRHKVFAASSHLEYTYTRSNIILF